MVLRSLVRRVAGAGPIPSRPRGTWAVFLAIMALIMVTAAVDARPAWCRTDPVVEIGGEVADISVSAPPEAPTLVTGATRVKVTVPKGVSTRLIASDLGFGKGTEVSFDKSKRLRRTPTGIEVLVSVYVPASDDDMPVRVEFASRVDEVLAPVGAEGRANRPIKLRTKV